MLTRRTLLLLFMSSAWLHPVQALAKDDSSGGGNSGSGSSNSGSGSRYSGRIVSVRLKGRGSNLHYRIRVIDKDNRLLNLVVNARTGQVTAGSGQQ